MLLTESGRTDPSYSDLVRLAERLAVPVESLLHDDTANDRHAAMNVSERAYAADRSMITIVILGQFDRPGSDVAEIIGGALHEAGVFGGAEPMPAAGPSA
jgi:transcriptional regulator with XRE-family HTH domain